MGIVEELRDNALALRGRKTLVKYEGLECEVHEPSLRITETIATLDESNIAIELVKTCTYLPKTRQLVFAETDGELKDMPMGLVKVLAEAATAFLTQENAEVIQGN